MVDNTIEMLLHQGLTWLVLLAEFAGVLVCCLNFRLSFWVKGAAAGFALLLATGLWNQGISFLANRHILGQPDDFMALLMLASMLGYLAGMLLLVGSLALLFRDLTTRMDHYHIEVLRLAGDRGHLQPRP